MDPLMDQKSAFLSNFIQEDLYLVKPAKSAIKPEESSSKVLVITEAAISEEQQAFLQKVLASVGITENQYQHRIQSEMPTGEHQTVFSFGLDLSTNSPYQQLHKGDSIQVYAHSLGELQADQDKKRALWKVLKEIFA